MTSGKYDHVLAAVARVLEDNSIIEPPVLPKDIAENYGLRIVFARFNQIYDDVMGFYDPAKMQIVVNEADPPNRQTFTIAHELGHHILHRKWIEENPAGYTVLMRQPLGEVRDSREQEANAFAANLLVPRRFLDQYHKVATVSELSRLFIVSEEVIRWRLKLEYAKTAAA